MLPKVSIIIPFYNCTYVDQAVTSALNQTYSNIEVIVVDDGSTQHKDKLDPFLSKIYYIGKANGGTASALNYGIRLAKGDYVAWLSSDDMFYPDKIERQLHFMMENQSLISFTAFDEIDANSNIVRRHLGPQLTNWKELYEIFVHGNPINGCTVIMKKELFAAVGMFNETLRYTQDYEFWIRVLLKKIPIHYLYETLLKYRIHEQMGTIRYRPGAEQEVRAIQQKFRKKLLRMAKMMQG